MLSSFSRVMLDRDLATVYGVETRVLNQQRERNPTKFPEDFAFKLNDTETDNWLSQNVIPKDKLGGHNPWAYTLEGCNMAATVLNTPKAVKRSVQIIRTFSDLERMAHGEEPKQPGFAEMMQVLIEQNKMSNNNIAQLSNSITLQGQQLTDGIVATNVRIDTEINPAIEQLKDEAKRIKEEKELLNRRLVEHETRAELERRRVEAMGIQQKIGDLVRAEIQLKGKQYWEIWKPHNTRYEYKHSKDRLPYDRAMYVLEEVKERIRSYLNVYPESIDRLYDERRVLFAEHGLWGNFADAAS